MTPARVVIRRYAELEPSPELSAGLDAVFFEASNTKTFPSVDAREKFRERWLGRYLVHDPQLAHVALGPSGAVIGYVIGAVDDPALSERFSDIAYFQAFRDLTRLFPAHLHVNVAPAFRRQGAGRELLARFFESARAAGAPGVHITTSRGARNVGFYMQNRFVERGASGDIVFLARGL